eukprot:scaffold243473_cov26-Tisochrysis_lutea.AAC.3
MEVKIERPSMCASPASGGMRPECSDLARAHFEVEPMHCHATRVHLSEAARPHGATMPLTLDPGGIQWLEPLDGQRRRRPLAIGCCW